MTEHRHTATHPDADQLNAFLSGALSEEARRESLVHLAECEECRRIVFLAQAAAPPPTPQQPAAKPWTRWVPAFALAGATVAALLAAVVWMRPHPAVRPMEPQLAVARPPATVAVPPRQAPAIAANGSSQPAMNGSHKEAGERTRTPQSAPQHAPNALQQQARSGAAGGVVGGLSAGPVAGTNSVSPRQDASPAATPRPVESANAPAIAAMKAAQPAMAKAAPAQQPQPAPKAPDLKDERAAIDFASNSRALDLKIEHNQAPQNGLSELKGTVTDASGAVIPGAQITLLRSADRTTAASTTSDAHGQFTVAGVPPGQYALNISAPGFQSESRQFDLQARDLALLSPVLQVGSASQTVTVTAAAPALDTSSAEVASRIFSLPGKRAAVKSVQQGGRIVALDSAGTLFFSRNAGKHWKKVTPVWKAGITQLALAAQATDSSVQANEQAQKPSVKTAPVFQITTSSGAVWLSSDGLHWHPR